MDSAQSQHPAAGKRDTELTRSHLCLSRALTLSQRKGDNETETKKSSKEKTSLLGLWVTGSRESPWVPPGVRDTGLAFPHGAEVTTCQDQSWRASGQVSLVLTCCPTQSCSGPPHLPHQSETPAVQTTSLWPETADVYLRLMVHEHLHSALFTFICAPSKWHAVYTVVTKHNCSRHRTNFPARPGHAVVTSSHRRLGLLQSLGAPGCCRSHGLESGRLSCQLWRPCTGN